VTNALDNVAARIYVD